MLVIVEKPFTPTHKEAEELIAIAKKHQRLLTVYQSTFQDIACSDGVLTYLSRSKMGFGLPNPF